MIDCVKKDNSSDKREWYVSDFLSREDSCVPKLDLDFKFEKIMSCLTVTICVFNYVIVHVMIVYF